MITIAGRMEKTRASRAGSASKRTVKSAEQTDSTRRQATHSRQVTATNGYHLTVKQFYTQTANNLKHSFFKQHFTDFMMGELNCVKCHCSVLKC